VNNYHEQAKNKNQNPTQDCPLQQEGVSMRFSVGMGGHGLNIASQNGLLSFLYKIPRKLSRCNSICRILRLRIIGYIIMKTEIKTRQLANYLISHYKILIIN
jgi:hypothetical protein